MPQHKQYWFPAKRYGWGWGPPTAWQGWVVLGGFVAALAVDAIVFPPDRQLVAYLACAALSALVLIIICWRKGEPPRWRWGDR
jgi:hypothetical protein